MKKLLALILALTLVFSLAACAAPTTSNGDSSSQQNEQSEPKQNEDIVAFINKNKDDLLSSMESSFATSSGMTCTSSIECVENNIEIKINIDQLNDVTEDAKAALQAEYDKIQSTFDDLAGQMRTELPDLEKFIIYVCEKDGDLLATIVGQ